MPAHDRPRTDPIASHAYTLPVVREVPIRAGAPSEPAEPVAIEPRAEYAADAHAW
jgi:hypothetical protein